MIRGHAAYEALAGAILLGEASAAERAAYAAHAAGCSQCDADIEATATLLSSAFAGAQHSETWRPFVRDQIDARIERRRFLTTRRVATLLSGAVAATLAFNIALAIGVHPHARHVALPVVPPLSSAQRPAGAVVAEQVKAKGAPSSIAAPARRVAPPRALREKQARIGPVLQVDPSAHGSDPAPAPGLPATLVTLPMSIEPVDRSRR